MIINDISTEYSLTNKKSASEEKESELTPKIE